MVTEAVPSGDPISHKRRSTRIVQAVPVSVTGTDALGQPFRERTSTAIISSHGCRYQSKHYVLKNRWVTLEVPSPQEGAAPRRMRARVISIQRPRTARELFQIGAELEVPGNIWGVAFPPADWVPYQDVPLGEAAAGGNETAPGLEVVPRPEPVWEEPPAMPALEAPGAAPREFSRLVEEARQEIGQLVRETAARAVATELTQVLHEINNQLHEAAEQEVQSAVATSLDQAVAGAVEHIQRVAQAHGQSLEERVAQHSQHGVQELERQLSVQVNRLEKDFLKRLEGQVEDVFRRATSRLEEIGRRLQEREKHSANNTQAQMDRLRKAVETAAESAGAEWRERTDALLRESVTRLNQVQQATRELLETTRAAVATLRADARAQFAADLEAARERLGEQVEKSVAGAAENMALRFEQVGQAAAAEADRIVRARLEAARNALEDVLARANQWLTQIESKVAALEQRSAEIEAAAGRLRKELEGHFESLMASHAARLNKESKALVARVTADLRPALEAAAQEALGRFTGELDRRAAPHLERLLAALEELAAGQERVEAAFHAQAEQMQHAMAQAEQGFAERLRQVTAQAQREWEEASGAALKRWLEELETKSTEATHSTFETLFKTAEWYQKKAQSGMQAAMERTVEQASTSLREKAAELSRIFAAELEHYSRSYVQQTGELVKEKTRDVLEGLPGQLEQQAEASRQGFAAAIRRSVEEYESRLGEIAGATHKETRAQLAEFSEQLQSEASAHAARTLAGFDERLAESIEEAAVEASRRMQAGLHAAARDLAAEREAQTQAWQQHVEQVSGESLENYRQRLENVSNSWMVASATTLAQRSGAVLEELTRAAEERLRQASAEVLSGLAETLRERLTAISSELRAGKSTAGSA